jgi:hypothetical protein
MSKELSTKEAKELAITEAYQSNEWGTGGLTSKDIIIPRINVMQPMSEKVTGGKAAFGEIRESLNNTLLGGFEKAAVEFVPFLMEKSFIVFDNSDPEDKKYLRIEPITPQNEDAKYEDEEKNEDGDIIKISRYRTMSFYVLLVSELKLGTAIPYILALSKTSLKAGKKLATQMYVKNINAGKIPPAVVCALSVGKETQDKKTWATFDIEPKHETPEAYVGEAFKWLKLIKSGKAKVDGDAFADEAKERTVSPRAPIDASEPTNF